METKASVMQFDPGHVGNAKPVPTWDAVCVFDFCIVRCSPLSFYVYPCCFNGTGSADRVEV